LIDAETTFFVKYDPKDGKWRVLCEMPSGDAFVEERSSLVQALSKAALRALDVL
jgi:hypothetical protein